MKRKKFTANSLLRNNKPWRKWVWELKTCKQILSIGSVSNEPKTSFLTKFVRCILLASKQRVKKNRPQVRTTSVQHSRSLSVACGFQKRFFTWLICVFPAFASRKTKQQRRQTPKIYLEISEHKKHTKDDPFSSAPFLAKIWTKVFNLWQIRAESRSSKSCWIFLEKIVSTKNLGSYTDRSNLL